MESKKGSILLFMAAAVGGLGFVWVKIILDGGYSNFQCMAGRYLMACIFMMGVFFTKPRKIRKEVIIKGIILGEVLFISFFLMNEGLKITTPSVNAFLTNTQSVLVPVILFLFFKKVPERRILIAAILTAFGAWLLSFDGQTDFSIGALLSLSASAMFSLQIVLLGKFLGDCDAVEITIVEDITVFITALIACFISGDSLPQIRPWEMYAFASLGFFSTFLYFMLQSIGQKSASPSLAGIIISSESVFAAIFSIVIYKERLSVFGILGCIVIFMAVILAEYSPKRIKQLTSNIK
jgi:drug/metabolite transporter (DMT)-like permease